VLILSLYFLKLDLQIGFGGLNLQVSTGVALIRDIAVAPRKLADQYKMSLTSSRAFVSCLVIFFNYVNS
jgi:hypothetical protein